MAVPQELSGISDSELDALVQGIKTRRRSDNALKADPSFSNWARTFACHPEAIFYPSTEDDVRCLVELARRRRKTLRPFGAGHSPSDLVCVQEDGWLMQMDVLNGLLEVSLIVTHFTLHRLACPQADRVKLSLLGRYGEEYSHCARWNTAERPTSTTSEAWLGPLFIGFNFRSIARWSNCHSYSWLFPKIRQSILMRKVTHISDGSKRLSLHYMQ